MALRYQQRLLADWPSVWAGWTTQQLVWNRRSENYFLKLIEARLKEEVRGGARAAGFGGNEVPLDPLLPGLKFVGPSGRYEAGALAPRMWDRLPPGALDAVQQLVLWMPGDFRLYWLLAELLNVHGDVGPAYDILVELREGPGANFQGLHEHRKVLGEAVKFYHAWRPPPEDPYPAKTRGLLLSSFCAPALLVPGPAGAVAHQTASAAAYRCALVPRQEPSEPPAETAPADTPARARPFDWWHLVIAFAAGALVSALFALQWLEWRRRRPAPFAPPTPPDRGAGPPPERRAGSGITRGRPR